MRPSPSTARRSPPRMWRRSCTRCPSSPSGCVHLRWFPARTRRPTRRSPSLSNLRPAPSGRGVVQATRKRFLDRLTEVNQDDREAARFIPQGKEPTLEFHPLGEERLAGYDVRLKRRYVQSEV